MADCWSRPESRPLRRRGGFCLGYTAEIAVSDDHLVLAQRDHQRGSDTGSLAPMTALTGEQSGAPPEAAVADCARASPAAQGQVEPVFGALKQQRGMRQFLCRGLAAVSVEWSWATIACNLTRMFSHSRLQPA